MKDQLLATLPLDVERQAEPADWPDWITRLTPVVDRCVVAASFETGMNRRLGLEAALRRRVPEVRIADLTPSASHIQAHPPEELAALIHTLVRDTT